jgi:hypothetical protein
MATDSVKGGRLDSSPIPRIRGFHNPLQFIERRCLLLNTAHLRKDVIVRDDSPANSTLTPSVAEQRTSLRMRRTIALSHVPGIPHPI